MRFKYQTTIVPLTIILLLFFITPVSMAANEKAPSLQTQYAINGQKLYVSVLPSLNNYYGNISHTINSDSDYAKFVTPQAVEPIAESIQNITHNLPHSNEQFADAVLTFVHQIPYAICDPKYPVETLVNGSGDCVGLSLLAASIMQAGGLDVVLIHYTGISPGHMNVGVYLPYTPIYHTAGMAPTDFVYDNKTYWTAETTAPDWKVGDQSGSMASATPNIIPLNDTEQTSPAQVTSSLDASLPLSSITIELSQQQSSSEDNARALTVSGSISPANSGENITIYTSNESAYNYFETFTDASGGYTFNWTLTSAGTYYITASSSGDSNCSGADSQTLTVFVGPQSLIQFEAPEYNYIFGQIGLASYEVRPLLGVEDFLSIPLGSAFSFSYDFNVLQAGQPVSNVPTETVTIPASTQTVRVGRTNQIKTVTVPEQIETVPVNVPQDLSPLMLPNDFNQTINNKFCFVLQNNGGNYSLNANALNDYEISNLTTQNSENNVAFMNATENIQENTWYTATVSITGNGLTSNLYDTNGTLIQKMLTPYNTDSNQTIMLLTNNVDSAVVFKNLTVNTISNPAQTPLVSTAKPTNENQSYLPYIILSIVLVATVSVTAIYIKKNRK